MNMDLLNSRSLANHPGRPLKDKKEARNVTQRKAPKSYLC